MQVAQNELYFDERHMKQATNILPLKHGTKKSYTVEDILKSCNFGSVMFIGNKVRVDNKYW